MSGGGEKQYCIGEETKNIKIFQPCSSFVYRDAPVSRSNMRLYLQYLAIMDEVPSFVHEEVVCRSGLRNVEKFQALLI